MAYVWNSGGLPLVFFLCSVTVECEREHRVFSYCIRLTLSLYFTCFVYVVERDSKSTVHQHYNQQMGRISTIFLKQYSSDLGYVVI